MPRNLPTKDEWEAWRANPITECVLGLYRDKAADVRQSWSLGAMWTDEARWAVQTFEDFADLQLEDLTEFYTEDEDDES